MKQKFSEIPAKKIDAIKRPALLLELMIAFVLVLTCAFPLLYPHFYMIKAEKEAIRTIELDRLVGFIYADLIIKLHRNEIPWQKINTQQGLNYPISELDLSLPLQQQLTATCYTGNYSFSEIEHVPSNIADATKIHYHINAVLAFVPIHNPKAVPIVFERSLYIQYHVNKAV